MRVKRFLAGVLSASMLSMMCAGTLTASANLVGDVDGSGHVNPGDSIEILNVTSGMTDTAFAPEIADVNLDGVINECDAAAIAAYYMGKIDALPAEAPLTDEPADPFPHEFSFSMGESSGYAGTTIPVNIYLDQSKDYSWLYELDAMRLSVAAAGDYNIKVSSVYMNANFWIGNADGNAVISGAYVKDDDITKPVATVYLQVGADVPEGTYAVDFVAEDCFIGNIYGQTADKLSFTGGNITVNTAPETLPTTVVTTMTTTTTSTTTTTTACATETTLPEDTTPVPDGTEAPDTSEAWGTEQTTVQTVVTEAGKLVVEITNYGKDEYIVGEPLNLKDFRASVYFAEPDGSVGDYYVMDESIMNSKYFKVDDSSFYPDFTGVYRIYVYYANNPQAMTEFDVEVFPADTTTTTDFSEETTTMTTPFDTTAPPVDETAFETTETPADTTYFDPVGTVMTTGTTIATTWNTTLATTETTVAYTTNMYTDEDGVVCFEYCANIGDTILVDETYAGLPYVITEECASYENGIITAISAGGFYMDFFASDALTEKVARVIVHIFAEPDETTAPPETEPVWTETTIVTTWHTGLHTTDMTTTTIASTLDENGEVIYGTTMPADTTPSGSDSEEEPIATTTSETSDDGTGTDWEGSDEVNGTTAVASDADTTETTTAFTEIAPEEPVGTEASTEIAPETSETTETIVSDEASTETTASEADTEDVTTTEPAETLPQTGNPAWFGWMITLAAMLTTAGGWMMVQSGIFKKDEE